MHLKVVSIAACYLVFATKTISARIDNSRTNEHNQAVAIGKSVENQYELELCDTLFCKKGEECLVKDNIATCHCRRSCPHQNKPVCATNGRTYPSYCHLYAEACWMNTRIKAVRMSSCDRILNKEFWREEQIIPIADVAGKLVATSTKPAQRCDDLQLFISDLFRAFRNKMNFVKNDKPTLTQIMFNTFDIDGDKIITSTELQNVEKSDEYQKFLSKNCKFSDLLTNGDSNRNDKLEADEFFLLFGSPIAYLPSEKRIKKHSVIVGKQYQLYCDIENYHPIEQIKWFRNNISLKSIAPYNFQLSIDGSLYLTPSSLVHNGNFSCRFGGLSTSLEQIHVVRIIEPPVVDITPLFILLTTGESTLLKCSIGTGYPVPRVFWDKNDQRIAENLTVLELTNVSPKDTGSYKCTATTDLGDTHATASVVVREKYRRPEIYYRNTENVKSEFFVAFGKDGLELYDSFDCSLTKIISGSYPVMELSNGFLCDDPHNCHWSDAVSTKPGSFLYASLDDQKLLLKINMTAGTVDQIFRLNHTPMRLWYVSWEDTLWLESWHDKKGFYRTIQIIRSASEPIRHSLSHALPKQDEFDAVENIFLPTTGQLKYGYITHWQELALHKIDLHTMKTVYRINLAKYDCHPRFVSFISQTGLVVVSCLQSNTTTVSTGGQILLDYISDVVLNYDTEITGEPVVTSDGQFVFTVKATIGQLFVQRINDKKLSHATNVDLILPHLDWVVQPDMRSDSWSFCATSPFSDHLLQLSTLDEKVDGIFRTNPATESNSMLINDSRKPILSLKDGRHIIVANKNFLFNLDLYNSSEIQCQIRRSSETNFIKLL